MVDFGEGYKTLKRDQIGPERMIKIAYNAILEVMTASSGVSYNREDLYNMVVSISLYKVKQSEFNDAIDDLISEAKIVDENDDITLIL